MEEIKETVQLEIEGRIVYLILNRPEVFNAFNIDMMKELLEKLVRLNESTAEIVIITGKGKGFSAGGDINIMQDKMERVEFYLVMDMINQIVTTLYTMPKLVISAVHGAAAGLGFSFALATDYILAHKSSIFAMNFIKIGLIPDGGGHYFINKRLGEAKTKRLIWEGKNILAEEAFQMGLIDEITDEDPLEKANELANRWLSMPIKAMLETKNILSNSNLQALNQYLAMEKTSQFEMRKTEDHKEGVKAFLEKRKPIFTGN